MKKQDNEIVQPGFMLFWEDLTLFADCLTAEELGHVLQALLAAHEEKEVPTLNNAEKLVYTPLTQKIAFQAVRYRNTVKSNRGNAEKHSEKAAAEKASSAEKDQAGPKKTKRDQKQQTITETKKETEKKTERKTKKENKKRTGTERETVNEESELLPLETEREEIPAPAAPLSALSPDTHAVFSGHLMPASALAGEVLQELCSQAGPPDVKEEGAIPSLAQIRDYIVSQSLSVDAEAFLRYYEAGGWHDRDGKPVRNWRQKLLTWNNKSRESARPRGSTGFAYERPPRDGTADIDWLEL